MAKTISELATEALTFLRRDAERDIVLPVDGAPQWFSDLCWTAHDRGNIGPDDWRYEFIQDALVELGNDADDDAAPDLDSLYPYTADRLRWLSSRLDRSGYCDEAMEDFGKPATTDTLIAWGMQRELEEVYRLVRDFLQYRVDEQEAETEAAE